VAEVKAGNLKAAKAAQPGKLSFTVMPATLAALASESSEVNRLRTIDLCRGASRQKIGRT